MGTEVFAPIYDDRIGKFVVSLTPNFVVRAVGQNVEVWVQKNLDFLSGDPCKDPAGDPRPRNPVVVTQAQIHYLVAQFDNNIYPTETEFFRPPDFHDGRNATLDDFYRNHPALPDLPPDYYMKGDGSGRTIVLVTNIRDTNFSNPCYSLYITGFFTPAIEVLLDRNVVTLDAWDWACRLGPQDPPCTTGRTPRPFLYEGTLAHEYQHLLHDDQDSDEVAWINEGMSDLAEDLVDYDLALESHINGARDMPENSLVQWGDQGDLEILSDYGHAYLFMKYLYEQFGPAFIKDIFSNPNNGIAGVKTTLAAHESDRNFAQVYHDYAIALLVDADYPGGQGRHYFASLDFQLNLGTPEAPNAQAYDRPGAAPWGTDYIWISGDPKQLGKLLFSGFELTVLNTAWTSDGNRLYSGAGDLLDNWLVAEVDLSGASTAQLDFDTQYQTEARWDFGFVQVSTDGGATWTSLANAHTRLDVEANAFPEIQANLPGFTGSSGGWVREVFDLTPYAGRRVLLAFRYMTDWATSYPGWYLDNIAVSTNVGTAFSHDGSSTIAFQDITYYKPIPNEFDLTFVAFNNKPGQGNLYEVAGSYHLTNAQEAKVELDRLLNQAASAVMLVTYQAPAENTPYANYSYQFSYTNTASKN